MTSIYDLSYQDIEKFLNANNKIPKNSKDAYDIASILLEDKNAIGHTTNIIEWMIAHNLLINEVNIPNFTTYDIDNMNEFEINELANSLTMKGNDRNNIKDILMYLGKLDSLTEYPYTNKEQAYDKALFLLERDNSLISPAKIRKALSSNENEYMHSNLDELITIFKDNRFLRTFIYGNMQEIIVNEILNYTNETGYLPSSEYEKFHDILYHVLANFFFNLMELDEFDLAKRAMEKTFKYEKTPKLIEYLTSNVLESLDANLIVKYFDMFGYINSLYKKIVVSDETIKSRVVFMNEKLSERQNYLPAIFEAALIRNKIKILDAIFYYWFYNIKHYYKTSLKEQMEPFIEEYLIKYQKNRQY